jgi:site-specific DNA recombinase
MHPHTTTSSPLSTRRLPELTVPRAHPEPHAYVRVSTLLQKQKGFSLPHQFELCLNAARLAGVDIRETNRLHDADSGKNLLRSSLQELLRRAECGLVSVVYIPKVDRMGRNARDCLEILDKLHAYGVELVLIEPYIDTRTPIGRLFFTLLAAFAEWEAELILERTRGGKIEKMERLHEAARPIAAGKRSVPYGLRWMPPTTNRADGTWVREPTQARWVLFIFEQAAMGRGGQTIAEMLNARGVPAPRAALWNEVTVRNIIKNPAYIGQLHRKLERDYVFAVPRIVSDDLFRRANEMVAKNRTTSPRNTRHDYLLAGSKEAPLIKCLICHEEGREYMMSPRHRPSKHEGGTAYRCYRWNNRSGGQRRTHTAHADKLDAAVWEKLCAMLRDPSAVTGNIKKLADAASRQARDLEQELTGLEARQAENRAAQQRLARLASRGKLADDVIEEQATELEQEAAEIAERLSLLHVQVQQAHQETVPIRGIEDACRLLAEGLDGATFEDRRWIVRTLVDVVYTDKKRWRMEGRLPGLSSEGALDDAVSFNERRSTPSWRR